MSIYLRVMHFAWESRGYSSREAAGPCNLSPVLTRGLRRQGIRTKLFTPYYGERDTFSAFSEARKFSGAANINGEKQLFDVRKTENTGKVPVYAVANDHFYGLRDPYAPDGLLERIFLFALAAVNIINQFKPDVNVIACHDWPTAMIPLLIIYGNRCNRAPYKVSAEAHRQLVEAVRTGAPIRDLDPAGQLWGMIHYKYDEAFRGEVSAAALEDLTGLSLESLRLNSLIRKGQISLLELSEELQRRQGPTYRGIGVNQYATLSGPELEGTRDTLAANEIGMYRHFVPYEFEGIEAAGRIEAPLVKTPREVLAEINPELANFIRENESVCEEDRELIYQLVRSGQLAVFRNIPGNESGPLRVDLRQVANWAPLQGEDSFEKFTAFVRRVRSGPDETISPQPGDGLLMPESIPLLPRRGTEQFQRLIDLGRANLDRMVRITLAESSGSLFLNRPTAEDDNIGMYGIARLGHRTMFELAAHDHALVRKRYGVTIPWYILNGVGEKAREVKDYFRYYISGKYPIDPQSVRYFEHLGRLPVVDHEGQLVLDPKKGNSGLFLTSQGHGQFLYAFSDQIPGLLELGKDLACVSGLRNIGARMASPTFLALLGYHLESSDRYNISAELIDPGPRRLANRQELGFAVVHEGRQRLAPYFQLPPELRGEIGDQTPAFTNSLIVDLAAVAKLDKKTLLPPPSIKPTPLAGKPAGISYKTTYCLEDLLTQEGLKPGFVRVPSHRYRHIDRFDKADPETGRKSLQSSFPPKADPPLEGKE